MTNTVTQSSHQAEIRKGERFAFGENWAKFLEVLDDLRIDEAIASLRKMLEVETLEGKNFLDIGSGSGLFSLAARRLGAKVLSFDFDPNSVGCTRELKRRYFASDSDWQIHEGSVLDDVYMAGLGQFDIVYSWGVLHHTGAMWKAIANAEARVSPGGTLFIALYNDQGRASRMWWRTKKAYLALPPGPLRWLVLGPCYVWLWGPRTLIDICRMQPFKSWRTYKKNRGMSPHRDVVDWVGGFPFEVSRPEEIFGYFRDRDFELRKLVTCGGRLGCNEYVLRERG